MNYKVFKKIPSVALLVVLFMGCKKSFIEDISSPINVPLDGYYTNQTAFQTGVTGVYGYLRIVYDNFWKMAEVPTDISISVGAANTDIGNLDQLNWLITDPAIFNTYRFAYTEISYCNNFLTQIQSFAMADTALKNRWIGEVKFIRALMYFNLVRYYGEVPLVLKKIETDEESYTYLREPVNNVYNQIIADLNDAQNALPIKYTATADVGRVTKGAAKGLLAKVYLTQKNYSSALTQLNDITTGAYGYNILPNYADIFSITNENNAEILFSVQYARGNTREGSNFCKYFFPSQSGPELLTNIIGNGGNYASLQFFNSFEAGDLRKNTCCVSYNNAGSTVRYTRKYVDNPPANFEGENNWIVLRYADILLMQAEVYNELNDTANAKIPYNRIRTRAGLPVRNAVSVANMRLLIENERKTELSFEGHRWFDLIRTDRMVAVVRAQFAADGFNFPVEAHRVLFPMPFRERTLNPLLTQNPGYPL